ncbi:MAG: inositol oxygenase family protein, partial [Planctomycetota bacterium]
MTLPNDGSEKAPNGNPLESLDDWEDFLVERYPEGQAPGGEVAEAGSDDRLKSSGEQFRDYEKDARPGVRDFYRQNHQFQTRDFVLQKKKEYLGLQRKEMGIWEAMEFLNELVDDSDPDTDLSQIEHLLQTSEAIRADGHPRWMILTGLIHDLGKILCLFGEPQWAVVGDTFPVGCEFQKSIIF